MSPPGGARYLCDRCGRDLTGVQLSAPCLCGALARRRVDDVAAVYRRPDSAAPPSWDRLKDWTAKYLQLVWTVQQLHRLSAPDSTASAAEVRGIVDTSLQAARTLGEWLLAGPEPASVIPGDVERMLDTAPLSVCTALASTDPDVSTRVLPVAFSRPPHFWVEYRRPNAKPVRYDALDLADRCLRTWQAFLKERGVTLPSWQN